jgi:HAE1 family hydrophobic/amphiphilic exporter-1
MNPIRAAVERPYTVAVAVLLSLIASALAIGRIPVQLKPDVDTPRIQVQTGYRGASAVEVEEQITRELEDVLQSVEGLVEMASDSARDLSTITLEFSLGTDTQLSVVDVINKLSQVPRLPEEADESAVTIASGDDEQVVMWIAIRTHYGEDFARRIAEDEIEARLERIPGVSGLFLAGGAEREVQVRIDPERMIAHGVTLGELSTAIASGNMNVRGGTVETQGRRISVRTVGRAEEAERLEDLIVARGETGSVRLGDVAIVRDSYRERDGFVNMSGVPGVAFGVQRQVGANVIDLIDEVEATLGELNEGFAARGYDVWLEPVYREDTYIRDAISFVTDNLLLGAALAVLVLLAFLRSSRSVLVVALSIPISLFAVFLVLAATGRTLNVISLAGIAFASGMVVDAAIVVLENVFRHLEMGKGPVAAAVDGGREVWGGVLASALTTVAVFVPILLQQDEASQIFRDIAIAISAAVLLSLAVALTVVPCLATLLFKSSVRSTGNLGPIGRAYDRFCDRLAAPRPGDANRKLGFVLLVAALALASIRLAPPAGYLPAGNQNLIFFFAEPLPGTRPEAVRENYRPFEQFALAQPEVERMFTVAGAFFNGGGLILHEDQATPETLHAVHMRLFGPAMGSPGFLFFVPVRASLFRESGKQFEVELSGPDFAVLEAASGDIVGRLSALEGVVNARSSLITGVPELHVTVDEERAKDLGLDVAEVGRVVELMVAGRRLTTMIDAGREVDVNVLAPSSAFGSGDALSALRFRTADGDVVSLGAVADVRRTTGPKSIRRLERERSVLVTVDIASDAPLEEVVDRVQTQVFPEVALDLGPAYSLSVAGSADKLATTLDSLTGGIGLSIAIIYLLLVALFRSWISPLVILVSVPLAMSGGVLGIVVAAWASGGVAAFDVIAMLGFVILAGLVVNNAILIVHQTNNLLDEGRHPREALAEATRSRLRPILMSVVTTVFGMLPLALGGGAGAELYQGLGAVIVGGLLVSTLFTLFLVPVLLSLGQDARGLPAAVRDV